MLGCSLLRLANLREAISEVNEVTIEPQLVTRTHKRATKDSVLERVQKPSALVSTTHLLNKELNWK